MNIITRYIELVHNVDFFSARITQQYWDQIVCSYGCTDCCRDNLTVFPLEYYLLEKQYGSLSEKCASPIESSLDDESENQSCALLREGGCLLYQSRPIICRTHGLPLLIREDGVEMRDCCSRNFSHRTLDSLPDADLLHLDTLNTILVALHRAFCLQENIDPAIRIPIRALLSSRIRGR